jgi:hypothetical protein
MRDMLQIITELGASAQQENISLLALTGQAQRDSSFMKTLTFVVMLYLPATLIAVRGNYSMCDES